MTLYLAWSLWIRPHAEAQRVRGGLICRELDCMSGMLWQEGDIALLSEGAERVRWGLWFGTKAVFVVVCLKY